MIPAPRSAADDQPRPFATPIRTVPTVNLGDLAGAWPRTTVSMTDTRDSGTWTARATITASPVGGAQ